MGMLKFGRKQSTDELFLTLHKTITPYLVLVMLELTSDKLLCHNFLGCESCTSLIHLHEMFDVNKLEVAKVNKVNRFEEITSILS